MEPEQPVIALRSVVTGPSEFSHGGCPPRHTLEFFEVYCMDLDCLLKFKAQIVVVCIISKPEIVVDN